MFFSYHFIITISLSTVIVTRIAINNLQGIPSAPVIVKHIEGKLGNVEAWGRMKKSLSRLDNDWQDHNRK